MSTPFSRRSLLRGAGAALLCPMLPSLVPRSARAASTIPRRLLVFFVPNGLPDSLWRPSTTGPDFVPGPITAALDPIRDRVVVLSGLRHADDPLGNGHQSSAHATLTGTYPTLSGAGMSFDQRIAERVGAETLRASMHVSSEHNTPCPDSACSPYEHISWRTMDEPNTLETSLRSVFGKLLAAGGGGAPPSTRTSVLDAVRADLARYQAAASTSDAARLDAFAEGLRTVERRATLQPAATCPSVLQPPAEDGFQYGSDADIRAMLDVLVLGFQCDATRVATYMLGKAGSDRPLHPIGVPVGHHELSHSAPSARHTALGAWVLGHYVHVVSALDAALESDGSSLLDHTDVLFVSDMGDGSIHGMADVPCALAGAGASRWAGQHLNFQGRPMADLYLSLLAAYGLSDTSFGALGTAPLLDLS